MRICRSLRDIGARCNAGICEIVLTQDELKEAYEEQKLNYLAQDIAQNIDDRIEDAQDPDDYSFFWPEQIGKRAAIELMRAIDYNDYFWEVFRDMVNAVVEKQLEGLGIDPETMKRRA